MDNDAWLQISFEVTGEQAEVVAEILSRYANQGVAIEQDLQSKNQKSVKVYAYLLVDDALEEKKLEIEKAIFHLNQIMPIPEPTYQQIRNQDWMAAWKKYYEPVSVGDKLRVVPAWEELGEKNFRIPIRINPGMAFGTGTHPTTQLSLELLERYLLPGQSMIDVGCGSGILSIAGILLGANHALAVDISQASVQSSLENCQLNNVADKVEIRKGSVAEIRNGEFSIQKAPLVVANIILKVQKEIFAQGLTDLVTDGGRLIISGILIDQVEAIQELAQKDGFVQTDIITQDDWAGVAFRKGK